MTNTLNKIMHNGTEYDFPEGFTPESAGTTGDVLTKTATGYDWDNPTGGIQNDTTGTTTTVTHIRAGTEAEYALITPDTSTIYYVF